MLVTVDRADPQIKGLLLGRTAAGEIATPVFGPNQRIDQGRITFRIDSTDAKSGPPLPMILLRLARLEFLPISLGPVIAGGLTVTSAAASPWHVWVPAIFLHFALFAVNDFFGHMDGSDYIHDKGGSRVIQKGWFQARDVRNWAGLYILAAYLSAVPIFLAKPFVFLIGSMGLLMFIFAQRRRQYSQRFWFLKEWLIFFGLGPVLVFGTQMVLSPSILDFGTRDGAGAGVLFAMLGSLWVQTRHLASVYADAELGVMTFAVWLGFDRMKQVLQIFLVLTVVCVVGFCSMGAGFKILGLVKSGRIPMALVLLIGFFAFSVGALAYQAFKASRLLTGMRSSFSSHMDKMESRIRLLVYIATAMILVSCLI